MFSPLKPGAARSALARGVRARGTFNPKRTLLTLKDHKVVSAALHMLPCWGSVELGIGSTPPMRQREAKVETDKSSPMMTTDSTCALRCPDPSVAKGTGRTLKCYLQWATLVRALCVW